MKTLAAIIALACVGCAEFAGNGLSLSATYTDPSNPNASISISTEK